MENWKILTIHLEILPSIFSEGNGQLTVGRNHKELTNKPITNYLKIQPFFLNFFESSKINGILLCQRPKLVVVAISVSTTSFTYIFAGSSHVSHVYFFSDVDHCFVTHMQRMMDLPPLRPRNT